MRLSNAVPYVFIVLVFGVVIGLPAWGAYNVISWWETPTSLPPPIPDDPARVQAEAADRVCLKRWEQETMTAATHGKPEAQPPDANGVIMVTIAGQLANTPYDVSAECDIKNGKVISFRFTDWDSFQALPPDEEGYPPKQK